MCRSFGSGVPSLLSAIFLRASSLRTLFGAFSLAFPSTHRPGIFTTSALVVCCPPATSLLMSQSASTIFTPTAVPRYLSCLSPWLSIPSPPPVAPLPPHSPAPSAKGGDPSATDTVAPRRSACLAVPPGFPPRPSSLPLQPVGVDSGAAGGGDTR
ncbi:unnamed protein product, partial [Closterium sp. NIES-53]